MKIVATVILTLFSLAAQAQLMQDSNVYLALEKVENEDNVNSEEVIPVLEYFLKNKTNLNVVSEIESADYILQLNMLGKNLFGNRKGKLMLVEPESSNVIYETDWVKGTRNMFYDLSGERHSIAKLVKRNLIPSYPEIEKE